MYKVKKKTVLNESGTSNFLKKEGIREDRNSGIISNYFSNKKVWNLMSARGDHAQS